MRRTRVFCRRRIVRVQRNKQRNLHYLCRNDLLTSFYTNYRASRTIIKYDCGELKACSSCVKIETYRNLIPKKKKNLKC